MTTTQTDVPSAVAPEGVYARVVRDHGPFVGLYIMAAAQGPTNAVRSAVTLDAKGRQALADALADPEPALVATRDEDGLIRVEGGVVSGRQVTLEQARALRRSRELQAVEWRAVVELLEREGEAADAEREVRERGAGIGALMTIGGTGLSYAGAERLYDAGVRAPSADQES